MKSASYLTEREQISKAKIDGKARRGDIRISYCTFSLNSFDDSTSLRGLITLAVLTFHRTVS